MTTDSAAQPSTSKVRIGAIVLGVVAVEIAFFALAALSLLFMSSDSKAFENMALAIGTISTFIGVFIGSRFAGYAHIRHAVFVTAIVFLISFARFVTFQFSPPANASAVHPLWWEISGWVLLAIAGYLGGVCARRGK